MEGSAGRCGQRPTLHFGMVTYSSAVIVELTDSGGTGGITVYREAAYRLAATAEVSEEVRVEAAAALETLDMIVDHQGALGPRERTAAMAQATAILERSTLHMLQRDAGRSA